jgi:hypothetical protein
LGVPNVQLVKEQAPIAAIYKNQSVAEQNSVDLAFDLLMSPEYRDFRATIYSDESELARFRQIRAFGLLFLFPKIPSTYPVIPPTRVS